MCHNITFKMQESVSLYEIKEKASDIEQNLLGKMIVNNTIHISILSCDNYEYHDKYILPKFQLTFI